MKEYQHGTVKIRIHDAENTEPLNRRKELETAIIKFYRELNNDKTIRPPVGGVE